MRLVPLHLQLDTDTFSSVLQNVLRASTLSLPSSDSTAPAPPHAALVELYGPLFADAIEQDWQTGGGRDVHEAVSGVGNESVGATAGMGVAQAQMAPMGAATGADDDDGDDIDGEADEDDEDEMDEA